MHCCLFPRVSLVFLPDNTHQQTLIRFQISLAFAPMQGFFNMAIFICENVDIHRQYYAEGGICDTANKILTSDMQEPCFISRISVLEEDEQQSSAMGPSALQGCSALAGLNCSNFLSEVNRDCENNPMNQESHANIN